MSRFSDFADSLENNEKKKKTIFGAIIAALILIFLGGMVLGARSMLSNEGTQDPYAVSADAPEKQDTGAEEMIRVYKEKKEEAAEAGRRGMAKMSVYTDAEIPAGSVSSPDGDEIFEKEFLFVKDKVLESVKSFYEISEPRFGDDFSANVIPVGFSASDCASVSCERGRTGNDGKLADYDTVFCAFSFAETPFGDAADGTLGKSFGMEKSRNIISRFSESLSSIADARIIDLTCSGFSLTYEYDALTGRIKNEKYNRFYSVTLALGFRDSLEQLGEKTVSFDFRCTESHWYTWAGISLSPKEISIGKGDVEAIAPYRTADEELEVTWESSDPETAEVDEKGYVRGKKVSADPVTITATVTYLGNTYSDTCVVFVRKPAEEIRVYPAKLTLRNGESALLSAEVLPEKATIKDVLWFTEDGSVAAVDGNGKVTATGAGTVKVYAISKDGHYRKSCVLTVTGN